MIIQKEKGPPRDSVDPSEACVFGDSDGFENTKPALSKQAPCLQSVLEDLERDFETERDALAAEAFWRHAALLLIRAADDLCIRDLIGAEINRQAARARFIAGNDAFQRLRGAAS
jgi:hypothetical protein